MKGVSLSTINIALRCIGLVLVVARDDDDGATSFWIETWRSYKARTQTKDADGAK